MLMTNVDEGVDSLEPSYTADEIVKLCSHFGNILEVQNIKHRFAV